MLKPHVVFLAGLMTITASGVALAQVPAPPANSVPTGPEAIGRALHRQLTACWSLPPDAGDMSINILVSFTGDGALYEPPEVQLSGKSASKHPALVQSAVAAVERCAPFTGLQEAGAEASRRYQINVVFAAN